MSLLAIDPGTTESGWVVLEEDNHVGMAGVWPNWRLLDQVSYWEQDLAIEMFSSQGMAVGRETFETVVWIGRFQQAFQRPDDVRFILRRDVQLHLCGTTKAKDTNIRQALIDLLGPPGTKAHPGPTYGVTKHAWAALGVAATVRQIQPTPAKEPQ